MQEDKGLEKKNRKFKLNRLLWATLSLVLIVALAILLDSYWKKYQADRDDLTKQIGDLRTTHTAMQDKQNHLEQVQQQKSKKQQNAQNSMLQPKDDTAIALHNVYMAIDKLPTNRTTAPKIAHVSNGQTSSANKDSPKKETGDFADEVIGELKSLVKVGKVEKGGSRRAPASLELCKMQLKLIINDVRFAWLYQEQKAYQQGLKQARATLLENFDQENEKVMKVARMLNKLIET